MIQRKQTLFLALSLLVFALLFIAPFASFNVGTVATAYIGIRGVQGMDGFTGFRYMFVIMQILATLFMSFVIIAIFMYTKRPLQLKLCAFAFLANVFLFGAMFLTATMVSDFFNPLADTPAAFSNPFASRELPVNYLFPTFIPILTLFLMWLTVRSIRKDEALARSLERLRK